MFSYFLVTTWDTGKNDITFFVTTWAFCTCLILSRKKHENILPVSHLVTKKTWTHFSRVSSCHEKHENVIKTQGKCSHIFSWQADTRLKSFDLFPWQAETRAKSFDLFPWQAGKRDKGEIFWSFSVTSWNKGKIASCFAWQAETRVKYLHALRDKLRQGQNLFMLCVTSWDNGEIFRSFSVTSWDKAAQREIFTIYKPFSYKIC